MNVLSKSIWPIYCFFRNEKYAIIKKIIIFYGWNEILKTKTIEFLEKNKGSLFVFAIILFGVIIRVIQFGSVPGGLNQDEAFAGYEAYSLLNFGIDSAGYHNPCYFVSWGSGMNVLESYLAIPFIKLFGLSVSVFRLPQLLLGCLSLPVFYLLLKEMFGRNTACVGLCLAAISPWHIMLSRWGLESNLAPAFLLFGFYFLIKGIKKNLYWIFSALMYGTALYAYSITWIVVPATLFLFALYMIFTKQKVSAGYTLVSALILFILALPLILFVLVNKGFINEIRTDFISIPKLLYMRDSEISFKNLVLPETYENFLNIFLKQYDGLIWNSTEEFGLFYKLSIPFIILGAAKIIKNACVKMREKIFSYEIIVLLGMFCSIFACLMLSYLNVNKANSLHFYTLILLAVGVEELLGWCKNHIHLKNAVKLGFAISFISFMVFYFGSYNEQISKDFRGGLGDAVEFIKQNELEEGDICVDESIYYPQILFFDQTPTPEFIETAEYTNYPAAFLDVESFSNFHFGISYGNLDKYQTYIISSGDTARFTANGFTVETFENYAVAYKAGGAD